MGWWQRRKERKAYEERLWETECNANKVCVHSGLEVARKVFNFHDKRVSIRFSPGYGNSYSLSVEAVLPNQGKSLVLNRDRGELDCYRPGCWEDYVASLVPAAIRDEQAKLKREEERRIQRFSPANDCE